VNNRQTASLSQDCEIMPTQIAMGNDISFFSECLINEVVKLVIWIPGANTISQMEL
jgi:hypothetical protein